MSKTDLALLRFWDIPVVLSLLTRLPLPALPDAAYERQARACWAFPLAGLAVGALAAGVAWLALTLGLPVGITAGLVLATQIVLTGAMHEDGFADTADGFWGGWTVDRRLKIMKDSRIGTYGVLALILSVGLRWWALSVVLSFGVWPVIALAMISRAGLPLLMASLPRARPGGLSDRVGAPPWISVGLSLVLGVGLAAVISPLFWVLALAAAIGLAGTAAVARAKIGGQTGDVLGAAQQICEIIGLLVLAALL